MSTQISSVARAEAPTARVALRCEGLVKRFADVTDVDGPALEVFRRVFSVARAEAPTARVALRCEGLVKRFADVTAVDGLDLEVFTGECFGLLGPNGAGKTTTVEILEGLTP